MSLSSVPQEDRTAPPVHPVLLSTSSSYLVLSLVLVIFAIAPLFYPGYLQTHHGFIALWNVADLRANLGSWGWTPHVGVDFDPVRSDGLLPYYLAALLPLEPATAIKVVLGLSWLLGNAGMFLWLKRWLGPTGALVAALVYTYLPYQIATIYVRGVIGEALFFGLLPWAVGISEWANGPRRVGESNRVPGVIDFVLAVLVWLLLGLSHLGLTLWAFVFVGLWLWLTYHRQAWEGILTTLFGVILATITVFSIFAASPHDSSPPPLLTDHFLYPFQLFSAFWGFGPSRPGWNDGMSFQLGLAAVGLSLLTFLVWRRSNKSATPSANRRLIFLGGSALFFVLLQFGFTAPLWNLLFLTRTLVYPWQLLGLAGLCLAVLAGASVWLDEQLAQLPLFGGIVTLVILSSYPYLSPQFVQIEPEIMAAPQALLGQKQLALLNHHFSTVVSGNTAGLEQGTTSIPLAVHGSLQAADVLQLNVTWLPLQPFDEDWKIFVHLVDPSGQVLAQFDGQPLEGTYPTSHWIPGEFIEDSYPLIIPPDAPPGPYRVFAGLYNEATGLRLPVPGDPEGRVVLNVE
ncbi:MAG: hypothetical protein HS114_12085 [Anaerolineales bacterium]|nr:hypothetical protein [Anaerolineales bacterium]